MPPGPVRVIRPAEGPSVEHVHVRPDDRLACFIDDNAVDIGRLDELEIGPALIGGEFQVGGFAASRNESACGNPAGRILTRPGKVAIEYRPSASVLASRGSLRTTFRRAGSSGWGPRRDPCRSSRRRPGR